MQVAFDRLKESEHGASVIADLGDAPASRRWPTHSVVVRARIKTLPGRPSGRSAAPTTRWSRRCSTRTASRSRSPHLTLYMGEAQGRHVAAAQRASAGRTGGGVIRGPRIAQDACACLGATCEIVAVGRSDRAAFARRSPPAPTPSPALRRTAPAGAAAAGGRPAARPGPAAGSGPGTMRPAPHRSRRRAGGGALGRTVGAAGRAADPDMHVADMAEPRPGRFSGTDRSSQRRSHIRPLDRRMDEDALDPRVRGGEPDHRRRLVGEVPVDPPGVGVDHRHALKALPR